MKCFLNVKQGDEVTVPKLGEERKTPENFSELKKEVEEGKETVSGMYRRLVVTRPTWYNWCKRFLKEEE